MACALSTRASASAYKETMIPYHGPISLPLSRYPESLRFNGKIMLPGHDGRSIFPSAWIRSTSSDRARAGAEESGLINQGLIRHNAAAFVRYHFADAARLSSMPAKNKSALAAPRDKRSFDSPAQHAQAFRATLPEPREPPPPSSSSSASSSPPPPPPPLPPQPRDCLKRADQQNAKSIPSLVTFRRASTPPSPRAHATEY